ncbi:MAG: hypothetical protein KDD61_16425, partial [Bdellovibrionales bacterium]|nr:hypothetical protein [Bdellovibrionales bacterium]
MKTFFEKEGTYVNFKGVEQKVKRGSTMVVGALSLVDISTLLSGGEVTVNNPFYTTPVKTNYFVGQRGTL